MPSSGGLTYEGLLDKPERLTPEEFDTVKRHPVEAIRILKPVKALSSIFPAILHHHESYDGTGYPDGLKGDDIPLLARILCIVDAYDSMTSNRPYRKSPGREYAISELSRCSGTQFDPQIVGVFLKIIPTANALTTAVDSGIRRP
ncbi:MAG: HD domain-containing protein [Nitrospirae bacterium]|nr:HD domain-containing protein [Nitrospirota bacterium]